MKLLSQMINYMLGCLAMILGRIGLNAFWPMAGYVWKHSCYVAQTVTGAFPKKSIYLLLVEQALTMPNAESRFLHLLTNDNDQLAAYCIIALNKLGRLDSNLIAKIVAHGDGTIQLATGQFRVETKLGAFANGLILKK